MSVQVRNRTNNATYVASSVDAHGQEVADRLGLMDATLPVAKRLGGPDIERFLGWLGGVLADTNTRLAEAEQQYVTEQADDPAVRQERDDGFSALLSSTIQVRNRVESLFGAPALATYGMREPAPRSLEPLQAYVGTVVMLLREHPRRAVDEMGGEFDTTRAAGVMEQKLDALEQSVERVLMEKRKLDAAMLTRNARMIEWQRVYRGVSSALAGLYHLAGETELASRIRPTQRRTSGVESVSDEPARDAPSGDARATSDASALG